MLPSREDFKEIKNLEDINAGWTDIQRAARFYQLIKFSYGSSRTSFGARGINIDNAAATLKQAHKRLSKVIIEHKDFENLINQYNEEGSFFYCDPPYYEAEHYYNVPFTNDDHYRLRKVLKNIQGKFLLSYNDCDFICDLYKDFHIEKVTRMHNLQMGGENEYAEVIISNYDTTEKSRTRPKQINMLS